MASVKNYSSLKSNFSYLFYENLFRNFNKRVIKRTSGDIKFNSTMKDNAKSFSGIGGFEGISSFFSGFFFIFYHP